MTDTPATDAPKRPTLRLVGMTKADVAIHNALTQLPTVPTAGGAIEGQAFEKEDEYQDLYIGQSNDKGILEPPYKLRLLDRLAQENNALSPCIEAMVTNVAKTGYDFDVKTEDLEDKEDDVKIGELREFFAEPYPGVSWGTIYEDLERDLERVGNAYLEVLCNPQDQIVFFRHVDAKMMRLVKLDQAVPVDRTLTRKGQPATIKVMQRERRYVQMVNGISVVYFRDFGSSRDLNKKNGTWAEQGVRLPAKDRASQIIHFTALPDAKTPYGVPRWISQLPSVLGSRKAEEFNLDFFDNGGVPPALILLQGGSLQPETRTALENKMAFGPAAKKNRIQILEVEPTGGSMDHPTQARVTVERFGGERTSDSMFEGYDDKCEQRVRRAFRLPPIFVGKADDYSFATAFASYTVAEAQVFRPLRDKFDEVVTMRLLSAMGYGEYKMTSKPLVIEDASLKLQGIELAISTNRVEPEDVVYEINEACGTSMKISSQPILPETGSMTVDADGNIVPAVPANDDGNVDGEKPAKAKPGAKKAAKPKPTPVEPVAVKKGERYGILALAEETLTALRKRDIVGLKKSLALVNALDDHGMSELKRASAMLQFVDPENDVEGLGELLGCTYQAMMGGAATHAH